ncbi:MAG: hypothetical protein IT490_12255 [Candidatus Contendobacter sp.]|nr:hypothetical protein [Candidatus Contendobacter sp.]
MTPLRRWIKKTLITQIPTGTIWSDTHPAAFAALTGVSHRDLLEKWFKVNEDKTLDYEQMGADPRFTTCSSFLPRFATQVRIAGHLPTKKHNLQLNKDFDIGLRGFELNREIGWTPAFLGDAVAGGPQEGDFFQLGHNGMTDHVGIIVQIQGNLWSLVAGGAGGRRSKHDGVKRTPLEPRPGGVLGWLDVDVYFSGWSGPDVGDV